MTQVTRASWESAYAAVDTALKQSDASRLDPESLEALRVQFLGRGGELTLLLKQLKDLSVDERRELGPKAQELRSRLDKSIEERRMSLEAAADEASLSAAALDLTLPAALPLRGGRHPLTQVLQEMTRILGLMGFSWAEGPLVETDYYNFEALNIPEHHSARDSHDTFYLKDVPLLMRTHTSPVQIRTMESQRPPLRIICPGRVFRHEEIDASHSPVFHQVEGLAVDKNITFADLKGTLSTFLQKLLGPQTQTRFRPSYFPFVEPGTEVDVRCFLCKGPGCPACKHTGWIEILGAGIVHPSVFKAVGYDPEAWSGFAFGIGVERVAMLRLGVRDMRLFYENDLRFLRQFDENLV
jgi:phenylalanyl-tRNA synthetase alpha chain